jgi:hypothetical protein
MKLTTPMLLVLASMILFATSVSTPQSPSFPPPLIGNPFHCQHIAVDIQRALNAFLRPDRSPVAYLGVLKDPLYTAKNTIFIAQVLLGDGFLVGGNIPSKSGSGSLMTLTYAAVSPTPRLEQESLHFRTNFPVLSR